VHDKLHDYAKIHLAAICNMIVNMDSKKSSESVPFPSYTVKRPFGLLRFALVEILSDIIMVTPDVLDKVPSQTWRVLSNWFLEYSHNNMYHFLFFRMLQTVVRTNHTECLKTLLVRYKFLSRIIECYKSKELNSSRGYIIMMANTLRLAADLQPVSGTLRHYLTSHDQWKQFLPVLRVDTQQQLRKYSDITGLMDEDDDEEEEDEDEGIDLGSAYARSLGFQESPPLVMQSPLPTKRKKRKNRKGKKKPDLPSGLASPTSPTSPPLVSSPALTPHSNSNSNGNSNHVIPANTVILAPPTLISPNTVGSNPDQQQQPEQAADSASNADWWTSLKSGFDQVEETKHKTAETTISPESKANIEWWNDLKTIASCCRREQTAKSGRSGCRNSCCNHRERQCWK